MNEQQQAQGGTLPPPYQPHPVPVATRSEKDVGITYVLWLLLGLLGAHKFYLGRPGMGVAYFLTLAFLGFGLLFDLFTIPSQVRRENALRRAGVR